MNPDGHTFMQTAAAIVTAIIGLAILSVVLSKQSNTLALVQDISSALAQDIGAATSIGSSGGGIGSIPAINPSTWD
jgi:hypothetical protein